MCAYGAQAYCGDVTTPQQHNAATLKYLGKRNGANQECELDIA